MGICNKLFFVYNQNVIQTPINLNLQDANAEESLTFTVLCTYNYIKPGKLLRLSGKFQIYTPSCLPARNIYTIWHPIMHLAKLTPGA